MSNKNYIKGRRKEYKICKELREQGFHIVQRSAGSHSPIDVWAIDHYNKKIILIQCKPEGYKEKDYDLYKEVLNGKYTVEFEVR